MIQRVEAATRHLGIKVEVRNQARVHLWFKQKFGVACEPIHSVNQGIDRFLMPVCSVGIHAHSGELYSTHGLYDLEHGLLRMNPLIDTPELFLAKARYYQKRWPWLTVIPRAECQGSLE